MDINKLIYDILPQDNEPIKFKKVLNREKINNIYKECFPSKKGRATKKTKTLLRDTSSVLMAIVKEKVWEASAAVEATSDSISGHVLRRYKKLNDTGKEILDQVETKLKGEKISSRIVSYYQDHSRALPKGKLSKPCEFGVKLKLDMSRNGYITGHDIYKDNVPDVSLLAGSVASHARVFSKGFKSGVADRGFYDKELIEDLQKRYKITLAIPHKKNRARVMTVKKKKLLNKKGELFTRN